MNEGVKILLERMKTNPEEFIDGGKWASLLNRYKDFLDEEDCKAITDKINTLMQQRFTEDVMKELLAPEEDDSLGKPWYSNVTSATFSATPIPAISSITLEHSEHLRAHLDALHKVEVRKKPVLKKPHQTLFGKLFNYS
jgi:hypothetical protein